MKHLVLFFTCVLTAFGAVPTDRMIPWSRSICGVPGGIPTGRVEYTNVVSMGADTNAAVDATSIFNTAISGCPAGAYVRVPPGRYYITSITFQKSNVSLIGDNSTNCILEPHTSSFPISMGPNSNPFPNAALPSVTAGATFGSTSITLSDASTFSANTIGQIRSYWTPTNEAAMVFGPDLVTATGSSGVNATNRAGGLCQSFFITGKSGNTLTFTPPLVETFTNGPVAMWFNGITTNSGIENLTIAHITAGGTPITTANCSIFMQQTLGCWVKGVHCYYSPRKGICTAQNVLCELRGNYMDISTANGPNGETFDIQKATTGLIVEDNITYRVTTAVCLGDADMGAMGNAILNNFFEAGQASSDFSINGVCGDDISFHGYYGCQNLIEGNITSRMHVDSYTGSSQKNVIHRNWFSGVHTNGYTNLRIPLTIDRWGLHTIVGYNLLGTNGISWDCDYFTGEFSSLTKGIRKVGYPNAGGNGYGAYYASGSQPHWYWPGTWNLGLPTNMIGTVSSDVTASTTIPGTFTVALNTALAFQDQSNTNSYIYDHNSSVGSGGSITIYNPITVAAGTKVYVMDRGAWDYNRPEARDTLISSGNYDYKNNGSDADPLWDTPVNSLFTDNLTKPSWWPSALRYPAVQPESATKVTPNPAMARFFGVDTSCTYSLSPNSGTGAYSGGSGTFDVTVTGGCSWTASADVSWIHILGGSPGAGNGNVSYSFDVSNTGSVRTGTITIAGTVFTLVQDGVPAASGGSKSSGHVQTAGRAQRR